MFQRATTKRSRLRLALIGPAGAGKTYSALRIAGGLGSKVALIDTERGSASKYAADFTFDVCELEDHHPRQYIEAIRAAGEAGYEVLIIDSLSHAWAGKNGALELVDKAGKRGGNSFSAWGDVTPLHRQLVEAILASGCHVIATMRSKMAYVQERDSKGKTVIRKVGLQPVQRDSVEFEFDVVASMDMDHNMVVSKSRCSLIDGEAIPHPDHRLGQTLAAWLGQGELPAERRPPSWEETLEALGLDTETADLFWLTRGKGYPEDWEPAQRTKAAAYLRAPGGKGALEWWLEHRGDPDAPKHPSFTEDQGWFMQEVVKKRGIPYDRLKEVCLSTGLGKPSMWPERKWLLERLDNGWWQDALFPADAAEG
jgi:hypothetical protein